MSVENDDNLDLPEPPAPAEDEDELSLLDDDDEEKKEPKDKDIRIPKARFDEVQAKARAREQELMEEIARLKAGPPQQQPTPQQQAAAMREELEKLQDQYEDLIFEGRKEDARAVRKQMTAMRDSLIDHNQQLSGHMTRQATLDQLSYEKRLSELEAAHPILNPDSNSFNEATTNEVASLVQAFVNSGEPRVAALDKAVRYVLGNGRDKDARARAAAASKRQPPDLSGVGLDSDHAGSSGDVDVSRLSQERFAKLSDEQLAKIRGDEL